MSSSQFSNKTNDTRGIYDSDDEDDSVKSQFGDLPEQYSQEIKSPCTEKVKLNNSRMQVKLNSNCQLLSNNFLMHHCRISSFLESLIIVGR